LVYALNNAPTKRISDLLNKKLAFSGPYNAKLELQGKGFNKSAITPGSN